MRARAALFAVPFALAGTQGCEDHEPVISSHSGGAPQFDGGSGRTDPVPWCDVHAVLACKCQRCHTDPMQNSAPFPLLTYEDTQADYAGEPRWQHMRRVVATDFMPPNFFPDLMPPVEMLTDYEKETIIGWADQGAEVLGSAECTAPSPEACPALEGAGAQSG
jgi:hypothetical protein